MFFELLLLLASLVSYACYRLKLKQSTYWQGMGVKCPPGNFPMGTTPEHCSDVLFKRANVNDVARKQYQLMEGERYYGTYQAANPVLILRDPELIKLVMVKDFNHFVDRLGASAKKYLGGDTRVDKIWMNMLATSTGETWKNARATFSPIFTSGKMKAMMTFIEQVNHKLMSSFAEAAKNGEYIELKDHFGKYTMDTIASCVFGVEAQSFTNNANSAFVKHAKNIFRRDIKDVAKIIFANVIPGGRKLLQLLQIQVAFKFTETRFFDQILQTTLKERKMSLSMRRNDLIDMMLDAVKEEVNIEKPEDPGADVEEEDKLVHNVNKKDLDEITLVSTAIFLLIAGYETTAQTLSYAAYELAMNPDVQRRLQVEIDDATEGTTQLPDYNRIQSLEYLDMVLHETLRKYPILPLIRRACVDEYTIPGSSIVIPKGKELFINVAGIHADPEYYPEPEKFNPERFSKEAKAARHPYTFLGFGQGPRNCIGQRFAKLEAKIAIISMLSMYNVMKCERTVSKVRLDPASLMGTTKDGLYVKLIPRMT